MNRCLFVLLLYALCGCMSGAAPIHYYVLNTVPKTVADEENFSSSVLIVMDSIQLPTYLKQSGLVLQTTENQIIISTQHRWAERLDKSLPKVMRDKFNYLSNDTVVYLKKHDWATENYYRLKIIFDSLHASSDGLALVSGRFYLIDSNSSQSFIMHEFYLERELEADGYGHAVAQINKALEELAQIILTRISAISS